MALISVNNYISAKYLNKNLDKEKQRVWVLVVVRGICFIIHLVLQWFPESPKPVSILFKIYESMVHAIKQLYIQMIAFGHTNITAKDHSNLATIVNFGQPYLTSGVTCVGL